LSGVIDLSTSGFEDLGGLIFLAFETVAVKLFDRSSIEVWGAMLDMLGNENVLFAIDVCHREPIVCGSSDGVMRERKRMGPSIPFPRAKFNLFPLLPGFGGPGVCGDHRYGATGPENTEAVR